MKGIISYKKYFIIFILTALCSSLPFTSAANLFASAPPSYNDIKPFFSGFLQACAQGDQEKAVRAVKAMEQWKGNHGLLNAPALSRALLKVFEYSPLYNTQSKAMRLSMMAEICRLSPDSPSLQWLVFKKHLIARPFDIYHLFKRVGYLFGAMKTNLTWSIPRAGEILIALILMSFMVSISFSVILLIKYFSCLIFYVKRFVRLSLNDFLAALLIIMVLFFPVYLNIGFAWMPLFWMALIWLLLTKAEKGVAVILLLAFIGLSLTFGSISKVLVAGMNQKAELLYRANYEQIDPVSHDRLKRIADSKVPDSEVLFTLGLLAKRSGAYSDARSYYQRALKADAGFSECMNNLGNIYLLMKGQRAGAVKKARTWYKKAIKTNPTRAEFYYNLSKSYPLLQAEGMQYIVKARDYNPELIDRLTKLTSRSPNQILVDCAVPQERLWKRAFKKSDVSRNVFLLLWRFFLHTPYDNIFAVPVVLILIIFFFSIFQKRVELAVPCARCGQLFFRTIPVHYSRRFCHQCQLIQQKGARADPEIVHEKEREIIRYQRRKKVLKSIMGIFPVGGSLVMNNRPFFAFGLSLLFYFFVGFYLVAQHILPGMPLIFCCEIKSGVGYLVVAGGLYVVSLGIALFGFTRGED